MNYEEMYNYYLKCKELTEEERKEQGVDLEAIEDHLDCLALNAVLEKDEEEGVDQ